MAPTSYCEWGASCYILCQIAIHELTIHTDWTDVIVTSRDYMRQTSVLDIVARAWTA